MEKKLRILIVPFWVEQALEAHRLPKTAALDIMTLSRILSFKDVCFYTAINMWLFESLPQPIKDTFESVYLVEDGNKYLMTNGSGLKPSVSETNAFYQKVQNNQSYEWRRILNENGNSNKSLLLSLYAHDTVEAGGEDQSSVRSRDYLFEVFDITDDIFGIRFAVADTHVPIGKQIKDCYDKLLKVMVYRLGFSNTAKTGVFNEFARLGRTYV